MHDWSRLYFVFPPSTCFRHTTKAQLRFVTLVKTSTGFDLVGDMSSFDRFLKLNFSNLKRFQSYLDIGYLLLDFP
jgi:hypothetical protein